MEAVGLVASVIAIVQISSVCLKLSVKSLGPSSYTHERLQSLSTTLYGFNGNIRNLQTLLEIYDDQARLDALSHLQEPLTKCHEALQLLSSRLQSDGFFAQYIMGSRFDKKFDQCLRVLNDVKELLELSLQRDQRVAQDIEVIREFFYMLVWLRRSKNAKAHRVLIKAVEHYIRSVAEDTRDINAAVEQNKQLLQTVDEKIERFSELTVRLHDDGLVRHRSTALGWLSDVDFRSNYQDALRRREAGTGQWLLDQELFRSWRDGPVQALWLHGMPGAGKTYLSTGVIDHLERTSSCPVLYFYFDFKDSIKQATESMIRSIALQSETCLFYDRLSPAFEQLYSDFQKSGSARKPTLDEVTELLNALSVFAPKSYIILDALDECQNREELLETITTLKRSAGNAKLFVTSRKEPDIIEGLTEGGFAPMTIPEDAINHDIGLYISSAIGNDSHLRRLPEELKSHIQNTLTAGAKSMQVPSIYFNKAAKLCGRFRWVKCQIDSIRLMKRPKIIREALKTLPKTLDETYERILLRLSTESEDNIDQLRRTLTFVTFAERPMTLAELAQAVVVEIGGKKFDEDAAFYDPKDLLSLCRPLIDISPSTGLLGFVHYSVQEFLLSNRLSNARGAVKMFALDARSCHMEIAQLCLTFVGFDDFADGPCQTFEELQGRKEKYPFLAYAAEHWPRHTQHKDVEVAVSDLMHTLLIPQKNPKLGSMLQACEDPFTYHPTHGDDFREFRVYSHQEDPHSRMCTTNSLAIASLFGFNSVLKEIVNSGADIDAPGTVIGNALHNAVYSGHLETVRALIHLGADINCPDCGEWGTALMTAIHFDRQDIVDMLLELKIDVNVGGGVCLGPLNSAIFMENVPTMKQLIQLGANIDFGKDLWKPFDIDLPLGMAVNYGCSRAFLYLVASGASLCNVPVEDWANALASIGYDDGYEFISKEWALRFAEELSSLGHCVEVVDIPEELGLFEAVEVIDVWQISRPSFRFKNKKPPA